MKKLFAILVFMTLWMSSVSAHPGHGVIDDGILHYCFSPEHMGMIGAFSLIMLAVIFSKELMEREHTL
jgi:hypothetical protein